jgi:YVTN family beta-propeller protein
LAYQRARRVLVEELGIDPGAELRRLQAAILAQDPGLDLRSDPSGAARRRLGRTGREEGAQILSLFGSEQPSRAAAGPLAKASGEAGHQAGGGAEARPADQGEQVLSLADGGRSQLHSVHDQPAEQAVEVRQAGGGRQVVPARLRLPGWQLAAAGLLVAVMVSTALVADRAADRGAGVAAIASDGLGLVGAKSGRLLGQVALQRRPGQVTADEGAVWVANPEQGTISRVDPAARRVAQQITVGRDPAGVAAGDGAVWVTNSGERSVSWINPATNTVVKPIPVGNAPTGDRPRGWGGVGGQQPGRHRVQDRPRP